jgi:hypothetical protein
MWSLSLLSEDREPGVEVGGCGKEELLFLGLLGRACRAE